MGTPLGPVGTQSQHSPSCHPHLTRAHTHPHPPGVKGRPWRGTSGVESPRSRRGSAVSLLSLPISHFPCCLTVFPANYPALLRAQATWQLASAAAPETTLAAQRTAGAFLPSRLPPRQTRILQREGRGALPAPRCPPGSPGPAAPCWGSLAPPPDPQRCLPCGNSHFQAWKPFYRGFPVQSQVCLHPRASCAVAERGLSHTAPAWRAWRGAGAGCGVL